MSSLLQTYIFKISICICLLLPGKVFSQLYTFDMRMSAVFVNNNSLEFTLEARNTGSTTFAFGNSDMIIRLDTNVFDIESATLVSEGTWSSSNSSEYQAMTFSSDKNFQIINLGIRKNSNGISTGILVPTSWEKVAIFRVPVKKCYYGTTVSWSSSPSTVITDWAGLNITSGGNYTLGTAPLCTTPDANISVSPATTVCAGDALTFTVDTQGDVADSIIFYKNGQVVKRNTGTENTYTTNFINDEDRFYAVVKFCDCERMTSDIKIDVLNDGFTLGNDTVLCDVTSYVIDAGIENVNYLWSPGGETTKSITVASTGTYGITINKNSCTASDSVHVTFNSYFTSIPDPAPVNSSMSSIRWEWQAITGASFYEVSTDSTTWGPSETSTSHTLTGLASSAHYCLWVRAINGCDTATSFRSCTVTEANCAIGYKKTNDTVACSSPYNVNLAVSDITLPSYKISWENSSTDTLTTYTASDNTTRYFRFGIADANDPASCFNIDSILVTVISYIPGFTGLKTEYCVASFADELVPNSEGGIFTGPGVIYEGSTDKWYFSPNEAGAGNHTISYLICDDTVSQTTTVNDAPCVTTMVSGGTTGSTLVSTPQGIFTGCDGSIYYTNTDSSRIYRIHPNGIIELMAGPAGLNSPTALVVHPGTGDIYFSDTKNHQIKKVDGTTKAISLIAGSMAGHLDDPIGTNAMFKSPVGLTFGPDMQYLYVADKDNYVIRKVALYGTNAVTTFAGAVGVSGSDDGHRLTQATFFNISQLASDSGYVYASDPDNNAIRRISLTTDTVTSYIMSNLGYVDGTSYRVRSPTGISVDGSGNVFFTDTKNCAIRVSNGTSVETIAGKFPTTAECGFQDGTGGEARFNEPTALSVFVRGYIDIADTKNNAIRRIAIENWRSSPFTGFDTLFCEYDSRDTLKPLYSGGFYKSSPVADAAYQDSTGTWFFDPVIAGVGKHTVAYIYKIGFCTDTFYREVEVFAKPQPNLGIDQIICSNEFGEHQLDAGGDFSSYSWYLDGLHLSGETSRQVSITSPGTYMIAVSDTIGCEGRDTVSITSTAVPTVSLGPDQEMCTGDIIELQPTITGDAGSYTFRWQDNSSDTSFSATSGGKYYVEVDFSIGCSESDTVMITENPIPAVTAGKDTTICITDSANLSVITNRTNYSIAWSPSETLNDSTIHNPVATPTYSTLYTVYITDIKNCTGSDQQRVKVVAPVAYASASSDSICPRESTSLFVSTYGGAGDSLDYIYSWSPVSGLSNPDIQQPKADPAATIEYFITVTDTLGCIASDSLFITVSNVVADAGSYNRQVCFGDSITLGTPALTGYTYYWSPYTGMNDTTAAQPKVSPAANTKYYLTATDAVGCQETDSAYVTVNPIPVADAGVDRLICLGASAQLFVTPNDETLYTFSWSPGKSLNDSLITNPVATPSDTTKYVVSVSDALGCTGRDTVIVNAISPYLLITASPDSICPNESSQLEAIPFGATGSSVDHSYSWTPGNSLSNSTSPSPVASPGQSITYYLSFTDSLGCTAQDSVSIFMNVATVDAGVDTVTICYGDTATIGSSASQLSYLYLWQPSSSVTDSTSLLTGAYPNVSTWYYVTATDTVTGCSGKDSVYVNINPGPAVNAGPDLQVCIADTAHLTSSVNNPDYTYSWYPDSYMFDKTTPDPYIVPLEDTSITYKVKVTDLMGCSRTDSVTVRSEEVAIVAVPFKDLVCYQQDSAYIYVAVSSAGFGTEGNVIWKWSPAEGLLNTTSRHQYAKPSDTTTYIVEATDPIGCKTSDTVTINAIIPLVNAGPDTTEQCLGGSVVLGTPAAADHSYEWTPQSELSDPFIAQPTASALASNYFKVSATVINPIDGKGCTKSDSTYLRVNPLPLVTTSADTIICPGTSAKLKVSSVSGDFTCKWTPSGSLDYDTVPSPIAAPATTTKYIVEITDEKTCRNKDSVLVSIDDLSASATSDKPIACPGGDVQLTGSGFNGFGSYQFSWSPSTVVSSPNSEVTTANPFNATTFILTVTDSAGCSDTASVYIDVQGITVSAGADTGVCAGDSAQLTAIVTGGTGNIIYQWEPGTDISSTTTDKPVAWPASTTDFIVTVSDEMNCSNKDTVQVAVNQLPIADAGSDPTETGPDTVSVCYGNSFLLGGSPTASGTGPFSYEWTIAEGVDTSLTDISSPNPEIYPSDTTTYTVKVTDGNSCVNTDTVQVMLKPLPETIIGQDTNTVCAGDSIRLFIPEGNAGNSVFWKESISNTGLGTDTFTYANTDGIYTVNVTHSVTGCTDSSSVSINITDTTTNLSIVSDPATCANISIPLLAISDGDNLQYAWSVTGSGTLSNSASDTAIYTPDQNDQLVNISLSVWNTCDSIFTSSSLQVNPAPQVSFTAKPSPAFINSGIEFTNTSASDTYTWYWSFGDGDTTQESNPLHSYSAGGDYSVLLAGTNQYGCSDTAELVLNVVEKSLLYVPNAFYPDASNQENQVWKVYGINISNASFSASIYNKWGEKIFDTEDYSFLSTSGWNGKHEDTGQDQQQGVYSYVLKGRYNDGTTFEKTGTITLIR